MGDPDGNIPSFPDVKTSIPDSTTYSSGKYSNEGLDPPLPFKIAWIPSSPKVTGPYYLNHSIKALLMTDN